MAVSRFPTAIILAAGASRRMGMTKALLRRDDETALHRVRRIAHESGMEKHVVVLGFHSEEIRQHVDLGNATVVENSDPSRGQTSSIRCGMNAVASVEELAQQGVCLFPVDHAGIRAKTLRDLLQVYVGREPHCEIVVPSKDGRRGHPVCVSPRVWPEFRALDDDQPAHTVIRRDPARILHFECDDPGVLRDFDTPEDAAWFQNDGPDQSSPRH